MSNLDQTAVHSYGLIAAQSRQANLHADVLAKPNPPPCLLWVRQPGVVELNDEKLASRQREYHQKAQSAAKNRG